MEGNHPLVGYLQRPANLPGYHYLHGHLNIELTMARLPAASTCEAFTHMDIVKAFVGNCFVAPAK